MGQEGFLFAEGNLPPSVAFHNFRDLWVHWRVSIRPVKELNSETVDSWGVEKDLEASKKR